MEETSPMNVDYVVQCICGAWFDKRKGLYNPALKRHARHKKLEEDRRKTAEERMMTNENEPTAG